MIEILVIIVFIACHRALPLVVGRLFFDPAMFKTENNLFQANPSQHLADTSHPKLRPRGHPQFGVATSGQNTWY
jgi:hypothetical protein